MLKKRNFQIEFVREEKGERLFVIHEDKGYVFVDRILSERDAEAMLSLVKQAYKAGLKDMQEHLLQTLNDVKIK